MSEIKTEWGRVKQAHDEQRDAIITRAIQLTGLIDAAFAGGDAVSTGRVTLPGRVRTMLLDANKELKAAMRGDD